jgi:GNAT superfamily N-acetyltransferase
MAEVERRWQAIDPLLPVPVTSGPDCGARLIVTGSGGQPAAVGACEHWAGGPEELDLAWGAARRYQLTAWASGPDVAGALDPLLSLWRDHLAGLPEAGGKDTAAVVTWPCRDIGGIAALVAHGLAPFGVVAARVTGRRAHQPAPPEGGAGSEAVAGAERHGLRIRRATGGDIDTVVRLGMEVIRFDAHFAAVPERPGAAAAVRREAAGLLAGPECWTWLAERDGTAVAMVAAQRPESAGWIAPVVRLAPAAYLMFGFVLPAERASGIGAALAARLHRDIEAAGVAVTLLHYEQTNPLSVPFWSEQGYRPLWTSWETRPAGSLRLSAAEHQEPFGRAYFGVGWKEPGPPGPHEILIPALLVTGIWSWIRRNLPEALTSIHSAHRGRRCAEWSNGAVCAASAGLDGSPDARRALEMSHCRHPMRPANAWKVPVWS